MTNSGVFLVGCALAGLTGVAACASDRHGSTDGGDNSAVDFGGTNAGTDGGASGCSDSAKLVYLVDSNNDFLSFKPDTLTFTKLGTLKCPTFGGNPFSMGVDRSPTAWVLYDSGELFKVSTTDASCTATSFVSGQNGLYEFGMGFASNSSGSSDETLFIAGGQGVQQSSTSTFATLSFPAMKTSVKGSVSGWPELTGTGEGNLWGFFPDASMPRVAKLDKTSGADGTVYPLAAIAGTPNAWAFAFWGGDFFVFLKRDTDSSTNVYRVNGATGALSTVLKNTGRTIVGAGVSTCAPTMIF